ncbi:MAG TPA: hypothetical protein VNO34_01545 [Actinomycetota bacterium]|nr:hypothetical protein [Actinomycetota bacterium]
MEEELKELLRRKAEGFDMPPEPPPALIRRARRHRFLSGALAGAAAAALVAGAALGVREVLLSYGRARPAESPTPPATSPEPTGTPSPTPEAVVTSTASPAAGSHPATLVAFAPVEGGDPRGRLILADAATGRVLAILLDDQDTSEGGIFDLALAPDGRTLYYARGTTACTSDLERLSLEGGRREVLASGFASGPAPSADGRFLAYLEWDSCGGRDQSLVVRDVSTGEEVRWTLRVPEPQEADPPAIRRVAWLPDSRRLACEVGDGEVSSIFLLDTQLDRGAELGAGPRLGPRDSSLELIGPHPEGLAVLRTCLGPVGPDCLAQPEIVALDPETGRVRAILLRPAPRARYALDASGRHFLYAIDGVLYRWSGGFPVKVAEGYFTATW